MKAQTEDEACCWLVFDDATAAGSVARGVGGEVVGAVGRTGAPGCPVTRKRHIGDDAI